MDFIIPTTTTNLFFFDVACDTKCIVGGQHQIIEPGIFEVLQYNQAQASRSLAKPGTACGTAAPVCNPLHRRTDHSWPVTRRLSPSTSFFG